MPNLIHSLYASAIPLAAALTLAFTIVLSLTATVIVIVVQERYRA